MYRCAAGGEMKPLAAYTASQQRRAKGNNRQNSGMVCKEHAQPAGLERYCHVCLRTLPIHKFSGNSRNDDEPRCIQCTAWDTDAEPGVTPIPLATGHVSVEENIALKWKEPTNTADFFEKDDLPMAPITGPEGLDLPASESVNKLFTQVVGNSSRSTRTSTTMPTASETSSTAGEYMSTTSSRVPPHLKGLLPSLGALTVDDQSISAKSNEVQPTNVGSTTNQLPPHLSNKKKPQQESGGSITGSISTATTLRNEKKEVATTRQITFNAWDNGGQKHRAIKNPTVMSSSTSAASAAGEDHTGSNAIGETENGSNIVGDWDNIPPAPEPQVRKGGKWPKSSEVRISQAELRERQRLQDERQKFNPDDDRERRRKNNK
ncbi:uncharacterized protein FTOL_09005 [Fusarium torulosum]|uniref:Stc1 domain-containing protein n=1 Tax=Fusarium torulosum TaxID=33205 RepID=A0AAE8MEN1_9HYPO|nr:uncharacterized protein FTOL_09005 [Fusarium torulosum]